jgi:hypothetical protein
MAWNGSGTFSLLYSWVARRDAGSPTNLIGATEMDAEFANIKTGLENCVTRDGQNAATAALPMGGYAHTGVGAATARTQYARVTEAQDGTLWKAASPGNTIDAMTGTLAPAITAYAANMIVTIVAPGTGSNTVTNPTINLNSLGNKTIKKHQGALVAGDYTAGDLLVLVYDGTYFELLNPKYSSVEAIPAHSTFTTDSTGGDVADYIPFIDTSDASADNKVLVPDFLTNALASITAKSAPIAADTVMVGDSAASGAVKRSTFTEVFTNLLAVFTAKSTPVVADKLMIADSAASGAPKISTITQLLGTVTGLTEDTTPDGTADFVLSYDNSATAAKKVKVQNIVAPGYSAKTGNYTVVDGDRNSLVRFSGLSADATLTLPAASGRAGFLIYVRLDDETYGLTIDPNSSELLDGLATRKTSGPRALTLLCDGSGWRTVSGSYRFCSANQTLTAGGLLTLTHGLLVRPRHFWPEIECTSTDAGYAAGDIVAQQLYDYDDGIMRGLASLYIAASNTTELSVRYTTQFHIPRKSDGAYVGMTAAKWVARFYAEE